MVKDSHWLFSRIAIVFVSAVLLSACAVNPVGEKRAMLMSEEDEIKLGRQLHAQLLERYKEYNDGALQGYVQRVGEQLATKSDRNNLMFRFNVLDSSEVNAFSLPGGYIYVTRGLLAYLSSEAELAAVLSHEIGHLVARHNVNLLPVELVNSPPSEGAKATPVSATPKQATLDLNQLLGDALINGYGLEREVEADRFGAKYLAASGYDPQTMVDVIGVMKNQQKFEIQRAKEQGREPRSYHGVLVNDPNYETRLREVTSDASQLPRNAAQRLNREDFLMLLDGLTFGESVQQGVRRDNQFFHKELGFAITFPADWRVENVSDRVTAFPRNQDAMLQLRVGDLDQRIPPRDYMVKVLKLDPAKGVKLNSAGLEGYTAKAKTTTPFGIRETRLAVVYLKERAFILAGAAKEGRLTPQLDKLFMQAIKSFHGLSDAERKLAEGPTIAIISTDKKQRFADLVAKSRLGDHAEEQLRLLNRLGATEEPRVGQRLKIIE